MELHRIESAILDAPAWAQIGLTVDHERVRASAAHELAVRIAGAFAQVEAQKNDNQLLLPLEVYGTR